MYDALLSFSASNVVNQDLFSAMNCSADVKPSIFSSSGRDDHDVSNHLDLYNCKPKKRAHYRQSVRRTVRESVRSVNQTISEIESVIWKSSNWKNSTVIHIISLVL